MDRHCVLILTLTCALANPKDFIEVKFDLDSLEKPNALKSYMNTLVNSNDDL